MSDLIQLWPGGCHGRREELLVGSGARQDDVGGGRQRGGDESRLVGAGCRDSALKDNLFAQLAKGSSIYEVRKIF